MQSIEEAARKYIHDIGHGVFNESEFYSGYAKCLEIEGDEIFKAGVEFAQQWISVNKELPEWYTGCRLDILVKKETFNYPASVKIHTIYSDKDIQELKEMYTHWRPINIE